MRNSQVRSFVEESVKCLEVGALRAATVFLWSGAIRTIHNRLLRKPSATLNAALLRHDPKARQVSKVEDFSYIRDKVILLAALDLKLIDKSEKDTLEKALNLRNRCGHPAKYSPKEKKVSSFIEDLISVVF